MAVREQKLRTEMSQAKRENTHFMLSVEKSKAKEAILERKRKAGLDIKPDPEVLKSFLHYSCYFLEKYYQYYAIVYVASFNRILREWHKAPSYFSLLNYHKQSA